MNNPNNNEGRSVFWMWQKDPAGDDSGITYSKMGKTLRDADGKVVKDYTVGTSGLMAVAKTADFDGDAGTFFKGVDALKDIKTSYEILGEGSQDKPIIDTEAISLGKNKWKDADTFSAAWAQEIDSQLSESQRRQVAEDLGIDVNDFRNSLQSYINENVYGDNGI